MFMELFLRLHLIFHVSAVGRQPAAQGRNREEQVSLKDINSACPESYGMLNVYDSYVPETLNWLSLKMCNIKRDMNAHVLAGLQGRKELI